jgi:predicted dehydrogenase
MTRLPVAVVGVGHLGKEHARILASLPQVELVGVVDARPEQAEQVAERCGTTAYTDHRGLLQRVAAAVVAVPTGQHHAVAADFLEQGVALLVEKPLAASLEQADDLVQRARRNNAILQVGHIERFNPAFEELQRCPLRPRYICCERRGGFTGRSVDVGVVFDLMIHDLDLVLSLVGSAVVQVEALGVAVLGGHEDIAQARLTFANGCVADLSACRVSPGVARRMQVWGAEGYAAIDFTTRRLSLIQPSEEFLGLVREGGLDPRRLDAPGLASLKADLYGRYLQTLERECNRPGDQLTRELEHFVGCVQTGQPPCVDGAAAREAIALATRIVESLRRHRWNGEAEQPAGPHQLPARQGALFVPPVREAA